MRYWATIAALIFIPLFQPDSSSGQDSQTVREFRVGIQPYDLDEGLSEDETEFYRGLFGRLKTRAAESESKTSIRIRGAVGSYSDIMGWCRQDAYGIDIVIATPRVAYKLLHPVATPSRGNAWEYLCTMGQPDDTQVPPYRWDYGIECIVPVGSPLAANDGRDKWEQLKTLWENERQKKGHLEIILVDDYSASGSLIPWKVMNRNGVDFDRDDPYVTNELSHSKSVDRILNWQDDSEKQLVAFVWSGAKSTGGKLIADLAQEKLATVDLPGLTDQIVPENAVLVRTRLMDDPEISAFLENLCNKDHGDSERRFTKLPGGSSSYDLMAEPQAITIEEAQWKKLFDRIREYEEKEDPKDPSKKQVARLALVLSGGGAKCAYQVGVIKKLMTALAKRKQDKGDDYRISLVVGTSGGAFNALPVALGLYDIEAGTDADGKDLESGAALAQKLWAGLDARDVVRPTLAVQCAFGCLLFAVHAILILLLGRLALRPEKRSRFVYWMSAVIGILQIASHMGHMIGHRFPWDWILESPQAYVVWTVVMSGTGLSGSLLCLFGFTAAMLDRRKLDTTGQRLKLSFRDFIQVSSALVCILVVAVGFLVAVATHFSDSHDLVKRIASTTVEIVNKCAEDKGKRRFSREEFLRSGSDEMLAELSSHIMRENLLCRDLVIAATQFDERPEPFGDYGRFFYARVPDKDRKGGMPLLSRAYHNLGKNEESRKCLMNVVIGSGAVFPIFPARQSEALDDARFGKLIDGSFSHHRPISVALDWGATHVIVVDPSSMERDDGGGRNLLGNAKLALAHLFEQAQSRDVLTPDHADIAYYSPASPVEIVTLLSFADEPIRRAIKQARVERNPMVMHVTRPTFLLDTDMPKPDDTSSDDDGAARMETSGDAETSATDAP